MDPRDALLKQALEALYWWDSEHGCCAGAQGDVEQAISEHLAAVGVAVETEDEWTARKKREHTAKYEAELAAVRREKLAKQGG